MKVTVTKDHLDEVLKSVRDLTKSRALIGVPDVNAGRDDDEPISNAEIGYIMETGSPSQNIPPRPHLIPGVEGARDKIANHLAVGARKALGGDGGAVDIALHRAGLEGSTAVKRKIDEGPFEPLAPRTLQARKARGRTGEKPLIDTGQYRNSITYVVRKKGES